MIAALQATDLSASLGGRRVLQDIHLTLAQGRWTCVVGPNGAGKSSLLKVLAGLLPHSGQVLWQGQPMASLTRQQRALQLSWLGQGETSALDLHVWDVVMLGRLPHQSWLSGPSTHDEQQVEVALKATQTWDWRERTLGELSGGERQRVLLARALANNSPILLMDEPLANLDPPHQVDWLEQIHCLLAQGTTVVSVLHEIGMALHADDIVVMREGQVLHHGLSSDAGTHAAIESVFGHRLRIRALEGQWVVLPSMT